MATAGQDLSEWDDDPRLFLFTSLTSGSSQIFTATSRMELILKANKIPFQAIDIATDEKARKLWGRRAGKRKLPGLVKEGMVVGDINEVEEWNEFGELKDVIGPVPANYTKPTPPAADTARAPEAPSDKPMQKLATETAGIALTRQKDSPSSPPPSRFRSLDGAGPEVTEKFPEAQIGSASNIAAGIGSLDSASSSSIAVTEPPPSGTIPSVDSSKASAPSAAAAAALEAYHPRDPTDAVPSAGTPVKSTMPVLSPASTPSIASPLDASAAQSSDSIAGGAGLADSSSDLAALSSPTKSSTGLSRTSTDMSQSAGSQPVKHRGSDVQLASTAEIKEIEARQQIKEVDETKHEEATAGKAGGKAADADKAGESVLD